MLQIYRYLAFFFITSCLCLPSALYAKADEPSVLIIHGLAMNTTFEENIENLLGLQENIADVFTDNLSQKLQQRHWQVIEHQHRDLQITTGDAINNALAQKMTSALIQVSVQVSKEEAGSQMALIAVFNALQDKGDRIKLLPPVRSHFVLLEPGAKEFNNLRISTLADDFIAKLEMEKMI